MLIITQKLFLCFLLFINNKTAESLKNGDFDHGIFIFSHKKQDRHLDQSVNFYGDSESLLLKSVLLIILMITFLPQVRVPQIEIGYV